MAAKYRIAIVGCGGISHAHGNAWRNVPEIEIVGACDEKFEALSRFATEYEVENTYNDLRQMLEKQNPDILVVATKVTHGNPLFQGTKIPLQKWFLAISLMANAKKSLSSCQLAREGV